MNNKTERMVNTIQVKQTQHKQRQKIKQRKSTKHLTSKPATKDFAIKEG